MTRPRILLTIPSLRGGGAERVFAALARGLADRGIDVHLALAQCVGPWLTSLPSTVTVHDLRVPKVILSAWPLWRLVRRLRPQAVLSTMTNMNAVCALLRPAFPRGVRLCLREATAWGLAASTAQTFAAARYARRTYAAADLVICSSNDMLERIALNFGVPRSRLRRIYNPLPDASETAFRRIMATQESLAPALRRGPGPHLLSVGRMDAWKGFDRLLDAFPGCLARRPNATLTLLGDGPERARLEEQAARLGVKERVRMPGFQSHAAAWMQQADLFVLASRFEGLPNVLLEALHAGCPVVAVEHPGGTREVLQLLRLSDRWVSKLDDWPEAWLARPSEEVRRRLDEHFQSGIIVDQYAQVLLDPDCVQGAAA